MTVLMCAIQVWLVTPFVVFAQWYKQFRAGE